MHIGCVLLFYSIYKGAVNLIMYSIVILQYYYF